MADINFLGFSKQGGGKMVTVVGLINFNPSAVLFCSVVMVDRIQVL